MLKNAQAFEMLRRNVTPPDFNSCQVPAAAFGAFSLAMAEWVMAGINGFWMEPDSWRGHCRPDTFSIDVATRFAELGNAYNGAPTQSPIEDMMLGALLWMNPTETVFPRFDWMGGGPQKLDCFEDVEFVISSQAPIAGYKVDFLVWAAYGNEVAGIAIECDGHAFHEKTKEQAARDKKRDREILAAGYPVLRFSGSEVYADPTGCVRQVLAFVPELFARVTKASGRSS